MSEQFDNYRRQAEYCEKMAGKAVTIESRVSWLRLASKWLALAVPKVSESAADAGNAGAATTTTPPAAADNPRT